MAEEIAEFEAGLAAEREKENERQQKMIESLAKRKEELLLEVIFTRSLINLLLIYT